MADTYLRSGECSKKLRTFQALEKHFDQQHVDVQLPERAVFLQDEREFQLTVPQTIRSPAVQDEYKAWLVGITERMNGVHHQSHKSKFTYHYQKTPVDLLLPLLGGLTGCFAHKSSR